MDARTTLAENRRSDAHSAAEVADTLGAWGVGAGMITLALFPLAIPIVALTAVALLPLLVPVVALGLVVGVVALPIMVVRAVARRVKARSRTRAADHRATPAHRAA